jgi:UDP:flavonoid glycosyltransferase YjiC (YdhE family)
VVSHAGSGTALATLEHGLPQLCLPQGADQFLNAAAIARYGAGLSLTPEAADADAISAAVQQLLDDSDYRQAASRVGASIRGMPSPDAVAAVLEGMV